MNHIDDAEYIRLGKKAREQSLRFAIENLQMQLDELQREDEPKPKLGRPPKDRPPIPASDRSERARKANLSYWGRMTDEERKAEGQRRMDVRNGKAPSRDPLHREEARRSRAKVRASAVTNNAAKWWAKASVAQKKKRQAAMLAGKLAKAKANGAAVLQ